MLSLKKTLIFLEKNLRMWKFFC